MNAAVPQTVQVRRGRDRGFLSGAREMDVPNLQVDGELPRWLRGSLLLNGPALWELPGGTLPHWFDGYAMLHRIGIDGKAVSYRSRFAMSDSYRRSVATGKPGYGEFGGRNPASLWSRILKVHATDNPAVVMSRLGTRYFAVTETPHVTFFDPETLNTEERLDLSSRDEPMHLMSAHGFSLADGTYLNVATRLGMSSEMLLFRLASNAKQPEILGRVKVAKAGYTHAFALAPGYAIVWDCALKAQPLPFRFGAKAYKDNFRWEPKNDSALHVIPLQGGKIRSWRIPAMFAFHATQAWIDGDDFILEISIYDDARVLDEIMLAPRREGLPITSLPNLARYRLKPNRTDAEPESLHAPLELQQIHPARIGQSRARVCWGAALDGEFNNQTLRIDLDSGKVSKWQRPNANHLEPLFVPRPGGHDDDDGALLVPTLADDDNTSMIGVIDARSMQQLAGIHAPQVVPFGFHAAFVAARN
ncbi:MAG TPA: carotenoid oxygenase family protein [Steroidobacteraceae bacterium]|nr:carotenoid oxygenase family protein [Steroidobacteraceae bacterium]